jgi:hypothetical protein
MVGEIALKYLVVEAVAFVSFVLVDAEDVIIRAFVPKLLVADVVGAMIFADHGGVVVGDVGGGCESGGIVSAVAYFGGG